MTMPVNLPRIRIVTLCLVIGLPLGLGACDTVSDALGIGKTSPDEYAVTPQRPLVMPPDYNLRAPQPGASGPADINASGVAARAMATAGQTQPSTTAATATKSKKAPPAPTAPPVVEQPPAASSNSGDRTMTTSPPGGN